METFIGDDFGGAFDHAAFRKGEGAADSRDERDIVDGIGEAVAFGDGFIDFEFDVNAQILQAIAFFGSVADDALDLNCF